MKICVISTPIFRLPVIGYAGLEHIAWQTARGLAAKGHEVGLVAPEGSTCPGATVIPCGPAGGVDEKKAYHYFYGQSLGQFDVIIDHSWAKYSYLTKGEGLIKCPILGVLHAPVDTMYRELPPIEKPCMVCISADQGDHFFAIHNKAVRVCRNGIDVDYYKPISGIKRTPRYLFLARFSTIKGADLAVKACKEVGVGLDLVGDTTITNEPEYFQRVQEECDGEQIKMVGPATRGECVHWFSQAHCLLHPNMRFREPLGLAPLEAMACGCPVVAWNYGAMRETVKVDVSGLLVDSLAGMIKIIKEDLIRFANRDNCRHWVVDNFTEQHMVDRYEALCQEAVDSGGW